MVALALPGAAQALGLGELHLNSALNEPLAGEIDIVGATAEDLAGITASVANQETFEHFGVDRPEFLSTVAFKISRDSRGRSVLAIRSRDACTEPLLNMLVDLRWRGGELVRQYTLLLDPPGYPSATPVAAANLGVPASYAAPVGVRPAASAALIETSKPAVEAATASENAGAAGEPAARKTFRVGAKATLRGIAWRVGSRSDADLKRMMIAIFHANPNAFEGNINRLRRGAVLTIPSAAEVSAISVADANHEVHAQMQAWHPSIRVAGSTKSGTPAVALASQRESAMPSPAADGGANAATIAPASAAAAAAIAAESAAPADPVLGRRVQQLEKGLRELRDQLDSEHDALVRAQALLTLDGKAPATVAPQQANSGRGIGSKVAAMLALAAAAFGIYAWRRRRRVEAQLSPSEPKMQNLAPVLFPAPAAMSEAPASGTPVHGEPRTVRDRPFEVPQETQGASSAVASHAETGERQGPADASARQRNSAATEQSEEANLNDAIDAATLEASYLAEANGESLEDTADFTHTATVRLSVDDRGAETMPIETRGIGTSESTTQRLRTPENAMPAAKAGTEATKLDYNLLDLDATVQYVQMPSALHENVGFKERRTSLVDALKNAVEKEPRRWDLRMKLLETYYAAAATNRQGFLDVVQNIAQERANLKEGEWEKIAWMGRQIASDDGLFAPVGAQTDEDDLANCA
jgi:pilus assembly protein FimV